MTLPKHLYQLLGKGENPNGMVAQTANGTVRQDGNFSGDGGDDGDNFGYRFGQVDGQRWNADPRIRPAPIGDPEFTFALRKR